jgi:putative DNA primase/helicase
MNQDQVLNQMQAYGLPMLPAGHPILDGKIKRFGPGKKAWYRLREVKLRSGKLVVTGAFGIWQGQEPNTVPVALDWAGVSEEERADFDRRQVEFDRAEQERKRHAAELAGGRARQQWQAASEVNAPELVPYLLRKQVGGEFARVTRDGVLLVPARKYSKGQAPTLVSVQKIEADGQKRFNLGADMIGAACLLGSISPETKLIGIAEGYASGQSARLATAGAFPIMVAFSAGNLMAVARQLRADFPGATILFLADDDWQIAQRYARDLLQEFDVDVPPAIDGLDHAVLNKGDDTVTVRAWHRADANGTPYIEADVRCGRRVRLWKFENAGIACSRAASREVGNAEVIWPMFAARGENKWTDFNDLHVEQQLADVTAQLLPVVERLMSGGAVQALADEADDIPLPPVDSDLPAAPSPPPEDDVRGIEIPTAEQLIAHFALIWPTSDIWDGLRRQRMKRSAFNAWVGKPAAAAWEKDPKRRAIMRDSLPALIGGRAVPGGGGGGKLDEMLEQLTLLRGTETVWDGIGQQVMTLGAVRADYTADLTSKWQEHALRKTIEARNLVFDPTQQSDPETSVNIFLGWPLVPKANEALVRPILALLESLCSAEDQVDECVVWILRWLAYPLQNPGAKMQTALLMFGEKQGTGKSLFFQDVVAPIYGDYGTVASQHQLDSSFTAWRSRKLFVLFEEVLSRDDKYSHNGTLKYMITGKSMSINQKNLPERTERNHMNGAFLSNEPQPIPIELEDRRFMVIEARAKQSEAFYNEVSAAIAAGGIEAFYHFLLNFPMDGFAEHTKPMMTLAKERVIEFGLNGWMSFHRSWKDGYLAAPYCSCLSEDLFRIYRRWCDRTGEKPLTLCKFAGLLASREHKVKRKVAVGAKGKMYRMIFEISAEGEEESVERQIERFRKLGDIRGEGMDGDHD